ncbi:putative phosphoribosyl transferase [compost metagenome]|uniref:Dienelactone hydrolase n=1 Tax=Pseudomonas jinjuensis TaxID=198616 RepID=A0A1H0CXL6_9PSED|nr:alpha/beta family hydrolase [Pseudomonas jinjuensis]SDN62663.1 Dienelactone hydrolase [Pseudomonas jinjuensis]
MTFLQDQHLDLGTVQLGADLLLPDDPLGLVVFVHGSGSSRQSPRNRQVARYFGERRLATLLFDLLTEEEQRVDNVSRELRFNIPLLSQRLVAVIDRIDDDAGLHGLHLGLFGASTGAAAALLGAVERPQRVWAVVCRGGRSDLAGEALSRVAAPTLQIVGGDDPLVLKLNRQASQALHCEQRLEVVEGATHLFEEPGKMEEVARLSADWFCRWLAAPAS